jgi:hypothetical protein
MEETVRCDTKNNMATQLVINPKQNRFIRFGFVCFEEKDAMSMRNT